MKLIDLLVCELPKRGGWPKGAVECQRFVDESNIDFYDKNGNCDDDCLLTYGTIAAELVRKKVVSCEHEQVTFDEYQAALAASQKVGWDGVGLPPVGCECEYQWAGDAWKKGKVCYISKQTVLILEIFDDDESESAFGIDDIKFRPLSTEAEKARDSAVDAMQDYFPRGGWDYDDICSLYDAIAAGKIPGVKLED